MAATAGAALAGARLRKVELGTFLKALRGGGAGDGAFGASAELVAAVGGAAYELPLPQHWSEEVDSRGIVYFWHEKKAEATWNHPMLSIFQATLAAAAHIVSTCTSIEEVVSAVVVHLRRAERHASEMLRGWTGPHIVQRSAGEGECEFFFNERTGESTWDNPLEAPQYELYAQFTLFVCLLRSLHQGRNGAAHAPRAGGGGSPQGLQGHWQGQGGGWDGRGWEGTATPSAAYAAGGTATPSGAYASGGTATPSAAYAAGGGWHHEPWQQQTTPMATPLATPLGTSLPRLPQSGGSSPSSKAGTFPSLLKQELSYPSFMDQDLGEAAGGAAAAGPAGGGAGGGGAGPGMLAGLLSAHGLPDELEAYVKWIRLSLASAVPASVAGTGGEALEAALDAKRSSLPPLTGLNLNQPSAERTFRSAGEAAQYWDGLQQQPSSAPGPKAASMCNRTRTSCSSGPTEKQSKRSSLPPLTALPLRRALPSLQKPPASQGERSQQPRPFRYSAPAAAAAAAVVGRPAPAQAERLHHNRSAPELAGPASPRFGA